MLRSTRVSAVRRGSIVAGLGLFLLAFLGFSQSAPAAKVGVLIAGDTLDKSIGTAAAESTHDMFTAFYCSVPEAMLEIDQVNGEDFTRQGLIDGIRRLPVGPGDALVVYIVSHGQYDDKGHYFVDRRNSAPIYRADLLEAMKKKGTRFRALIADSCNMYLPVGEISRHYVAPAFQPAERLSPMCAKLLFGYQGLLDVNSSSPDQPALCIPKLGGLFSMTLSLPYDDQILDELFQDEIRKGSRLGRTIQAIDFTPGLLFSADNQTRTWDDVLNYCQNELNGRFRPVYKSLNVTQTIARNQMPTPAAIPADIKRAQAGTGPAPPGGGQWQPGGGQPGGHGQPGGGHGGGQPGPRRIAPGTVVTLSPGDVILSINGRRIGGTRDFWNAVKASPEIMQFTLQSSGDGQVYRLKARLFNVTRDSRFGVVGEAIPDRPGVRVRSIRRGYPGARSVIVE